MGIPWVAERSVGFRVHPWLGFFPAFRAVEEHPHRQVGRELFEAVDHTGWDEEDVPRPETVVLVSISEPARSLSHHVHLVASVGRLGIVLAWGVELDAQRAVAEQLDEPLPARPWQSTHTLGHGKLVLGHWRVSKS